MTATTVIRFRVTPCVVAPPLSEPAFHSWTHTGPPPISVLSKRPYGPYLGSSCRQRGLSSAASVPTPDAATGGPAPSGRGIVEGAADAPCAAGTMNAAAPTPNAASAATAHRRTRSRPRAIRYPPSLELRRSEVVRSRRRRKRLVVDASARERARHAQLALLGFVPVAADAHCSATPTTRSLSINATSGSPTLPFADDEVRPVPPLYWVGSIRGGRAGFPNYA